MNTTKALGVLNLKPKDIYSLIEAEKFDDVSIGTLVAAKIFELKCRFIFEEHFRV